MARRLLSILLHSSAGIAVIAVLGLVSSVVGCAIPYGAPVYGGLVNNNVRGPVAGVDNSVKPAKKGEAIATSIVFLGQGDASISAAMDDAGITKVHHVDNETFSILGLYATYKTIVYGE